ncbi:MAG TPA: transporter [Noviherbaspirillum sp.]|uniref:transporter n=1 Tax=Noviherbaspirillum sp. TaxID=1926288 RepID=UPI002D5B8713|nr:transporter [Noviherbaspirillum sp.]HYD93860.1 transporter [Noviherbaspirillum sp.]
MKASKIVALAVCGGALGIVLPSSALASCGTAFCTVNSNWTSESAATETGSVLDLRYEYVSQNQPRSGTDDVAVGQIRKHHDEVKTVNRNLILSYSHTFSSGWGLSVTAPVVDRNHFHIHNHHGAQLPERWDFTELGDMRVIGRYQSPDMGDPRSPRATGISFGLKLPTGRTSVGNASGDVAERTLQPGTGTTDAILGAYYHQKLPQSNASWFAQAQYQQALNSRDNFKPGAQLSADVGYRHGVTDQLGALIQLNLLLKRRDSGSAAEPADSGARYLSLSPGLSYAVSDNVQVYGFFQKPLYQHVNGVQLTADKALVIGVSGRF